MSAQRELSLRQQTLRILNDCAGYLLPEPRLIEQIQMSISPTPTVLECEQSVRFLEANHYIAGVTPDLGGPRKWKITEMGKTEI